jgi:hypothetical protein
MPYIKQEEREKFDSLVNQITSLIDPNDFEGELNYVITTLIHKVLCEPFMHYKDFNGIMGVLECVKQEYYRRKVAPYEDRKIKENGDV